MSLTDGRRIYAIGDVHGCRSDLQSVLDWIRRDLSEFPHANPVIVFVGDYADRGPDIRGTLDDLVALRDGSVDNIFLRGNHDQYFLNYLDDPHAPATQRLHWLDDPLGGGWTLRAYGVDRPVASRPEECHATFVANVPAEHVAFLNNTGLTHGIGGYLFVHAGIRPGIALAEQTDQDLLFIREPFLSSPLSHPEGVVVHGHSAVNGLEHHGNRINVDGGAVFGGRLVCCVLEDDLVWDLQAQGRVAAREGYGLG